VPGYDPRFWELSFDPGDLDALPGDLFDALGDADDDDDDDDPERAQARREVLSAVAELVRTGLTDKQRLMVERYFYDGRTQQEIAAELGISQQVVSRQLFGVVRNGRRVGGAITRLRKAFESTGALAQLPRYRQRALFALLRAPRLTDEAVAILRDFVTNGSKEEAVSATRRLCGYRIVRRETLDDEQLRFVEPAWGHVLVWILDR
jgi:DNA-binding transcriptional ArsR family regulator